MISYNTRNILSEGNFLKLHAIADEKLLQIQTISRKLPNIIWKSLANGNTRNIFSKFLETPHKFSKALIKKKWQQKYI